MMRRWTTITTAFCCALSAASPARADRLAGVTIDGAWMRVLTAGIPAGGYFTLRNARATALVLTGASSPDCGMLMLHESRDQGGMERMREVDNLVVPAGGALTFAPGSYHLMCTNPSAAMRPGGQVPVTLRFGSGDTLTAPFAIHGARGP